MPEHSQHSSYTHKELIPVRWAACEKLADMNIEMSSLCDYLQYTEIYTIFMHTQAYYTHTLYGPKTEECAYNPKPIMTAIQTTYHLCVSRTRAPLNNDMSAIITHTVPMLPEELVPYKVTQALLYSLHNTHEYVFNLIRDKASMRALSNMTAFDMFEYYMQNIHLITLCDTATCNTRKQASLKRVYVAIGHTCHSYCENINIHFDNTANTNTEPMQHIDVGCFGLPMHPFPDLIVESHRWSAIGYKRTNNIVYYVHSLLSVVTILLGTIIIERILDYVMRKMHSILNRAWNTLRGMQNTEH